MVECSMLRHLPSRCHSDSTILVELPTSHLLRHMVLPAHVLNRQELEDTNQRRVPSDFLMTTPSPVRLLMLFISLSDGSLVLGQYHCEPDEEITSVETFNLNVEGREVPFFCLGTLIYDPEEKEPSKGRLLVFTATTSPSKVSTLELSMLASARVKGCVFSLKIVNKKIVAAVNSSVCQS